LRDTLLCARGDENLNFGTDHSRGDCAYITENGTMLVGNRAHVVQFAISREFKQADPIISATSDNKGAVV